ncbi:hypothetical protein [Streptomyces sp. Ag109_O5-10]|uniref:hypothetical protein n=1 Tax=Streptomyces sp. Ag109_O5-10 TaxID=1855349 RepID=UPI00115FE219|nr:hypothetical protein [Streptomyces sp. Ag109_O5-10]
MASTVGQGERPLKTSQKSKLDVVVGVRMTYPPAAATASIHELRRGDGVSDDGMPILLFRTCLLETEDLGGVDGRDRRGHEPFEAVV